MRRMGEAALRESDPADLSLWELAWQRYLLDNPEVMASWGYQNAYWPPGHPSRDTQGEVVTARLEAEECRSCGHRAWAHGDQSGWPSTGEPCHAARNSSLDGCNTCPGGYNVLAGPRG